MAGLSIENLFVLSDVLQMELTLNAAGTISGKVGKQILVPEIGLKMNVTAEVVSSKVGEAGGDFIVGLIVRIQGNMYVAAIHERASDLVRVFVLDQAKMADKLDGLFEAYPKNGFGSLTGLLRRASVAEWTRTEYGEKWTQQEKVAA